MKWKNLFVILAFLAVLIPSSIQAGEPIQEWVSIYDGSSRDLPYAIAVDSSSNVYVTGSSATIKYDTDGNELWVKNYSGGGSDIALDSSGNVYVAGSVTIKYDSNGNELWVQSGGGTAIAVDSSGNVYVTGFNITRKYDTNGNLQWERPYILTVHDIDLDASGNVYVFGRNQAVKYDTNGNEQWAIEYDISVGFNLYFSGAVVSPSGNVYVTGWANFGITIYDNDVVTIKYDTNGIQKWFKTYNESEDNWEDWGEAIAVDSSDNVYVTGGSWNYTTEEYDYVTIKYDTDRPGS
jgi:hypothetical protein